MEKVLNKIYEWIDKIGKHNFMLLVFILIVTIVTGLYTTFSIMTSTDPSELIDGLLTYKFILNADSDTNSVTIASGSSKLIDITVSNEEKQKLQYGIYYSSNDDLSKVNLGYVKNSTYPSTGLIEEQSNYVVTIKIDNKSESDITINFGLVFGLEKGGDLIYPEGSNLIDKYIQYGNAAKFIQSLYEDGSSINTVHIAGDTSKPQVHLNSTQGIMLDNNGDYRYYGATPNNYVEYNGELWRIISVSKVFSSEEDTTGETRVRIIKDTKIGDYAWNTEGTNNWADATLMCQLNTLYYNDTVPACTGKSLDSLTTSLNAAASSLIDNALWYLGGGNESDLYADDYYTMERGTAVANSSYPSRWTGKIGIMYPSDYAYAADLSQCTKTGIYYDTDTTNCLNTDWLFNSEYQWLMSPYSGVSFVAWIVNDSGYVIYDDDALVEYEYGVRPLAVLKSDVVITSGKGTSENPYKLVLEGLESDSTEDTEQAEVAEYGELATTYIHDLYEDGSTKNEVTIGSGNQIVKQNSSKGIMYINQGNTYGEEYRYYGATPNNYVRYNGELWRIISSSTVYSSESDTTGETRVRIIRDEKIGDYVWDDITSEEENGNWSENWTDATLMCQLNTLYYNDTVPACTGKSLTSLTTSLNAEAKSLIDDALWYLGGVETYSNLYANDYYTMERGTAISDSSYPYRWTGKLGLMYPSDYVYAADLSVCKMPGFDTEYIGYSDSNCKGTDWLFNSDDQWLISTYSNIVGGVCSVYEDGYISPGSESEIDAVFGVRPVVVLKSDVVITGGDGSSSNPYTLQ